MHALTTSAEVANAIRALAPPVGAVIGVDGFRCSGKSTLAAAVAAALAAAHVNVDDYRTAGAEFRHFTETVDVRGLRAAIAAAARSSPVVIFDSICLRDVTTHLALFLMATIYVKRISTHGIWHDGVDLDDFDPAADGVEGVFTDDEMRYHKRYMPHLNATIVYRRTESDPVDD